MVCDRICGTGRRKQRIEELDLSDQIKRILPLLGKYKKVALMVLALSALASTIFFGIGVAIIIELILIMLAIYLIAPYVSLKKIPTMHIGVPLVLGERKEGFILKEGWAIVVKGIFEYVPVHVGKVDLDFVVTVHTKANAKLELPATMLIKADKNKINEFLEVGGWHGEDVKGNGNSEIANTIINRAKSAITAISKTKTLDEILEVDEGITAGAIGILTDASDTSSINSLKPNAEHRVPGLGIMINNFVIKEPKPVEKIAEVFEMQTVEMERRALELTNLNTKLLQIQRMKESGLTIDAERLYLILIDQELLEKGHKITPGLNNVLNEIAGLVARGAGIGEILDSITKYKGGK